MIKNSTDGKLFVFNYSKAPKIKFRFVFVNPKLGGVKNIWRLIMNIPIITLKNSKNTDYKS